MIQRSRAAFVLFRFVLSAQVRQADAEDRRGLGVHFVVQAVPKFVQFLGFSISIEIQFSFIVEAAAVAEADENRCRFSGRGLPVVFLFGFFDGL